MFDYLIKILCLSFPKLMIFLAVVVFAVLVFGWEWVLLLFVLVLVSGLLWGFTAGGGKADESVPTDNPAKSRLLAEWDDPDDYDERMEELEDELDELEDELEELRDELEDEELEKFLSKTSAEEQQERLDALTKKLEYLRAQHESLRKG